MTLIRTQTYRAHTGTALRGRQSFVSRAVDHSSVKTQLCWKPEMGFHPGKV